MVYIVGQVMEVMVMVKVIARGCESDSDNREVIVTEDEGINR